MAVSSALPSYISDQLYPVTPQTRSGTLTLDLDYLTLFRVRELVQIDALWFFRTATTAANTYVGIYDAVTWALLTDAAVSTNTTAGIKTSSITPITLSPTTFYALVCNTSASTTIGATASAARAMDVFSNGLAAGMTDVSPTTTVGYSKTRTNAALLSTLTPTGFAVSETMFGGFIKV